jgi:hypothetical protein
MWADLVAHPVSDAGGALLLALNEPEALRLNALLFPGLNGGNRLFDRFSQDRVEKRCAGLLLEGELATLAGADLDALEAHSAHE